MAAGAALVGLGADEVTLARAEARADMPPESAMSDTHAPARTPAPLRRVGGQNARARKLPFIIQARVDEALYERFLAICDEAGIGAAETLRRLISNGSVRSNVDAKAVADLGRLGGLAKHFLNEYRDTPDAGEIKDELRKILAAVREKIEAFGGPNLGAKRGRLRKPGKGD